MKWRSNSISDLGSIAQNLVHEIGRPSIVLLNGKMGAGKTTFTKAILDQLGGGDGGNSPTFSIANEYPLENGESVYHFDLYRLESMEEVMDIGIEEYLYSDSWIFIEWPDHAIELLPEDYWIVSIEVEGEERIITLSSSS